MMDLTGTAAQLSKECSPASAESSSHAIPTHIRTSCDLCKRMKIKCERQGESCVHCIARGVRCDMTLIQRKKQAKRGNPLKDVESRIQRIESVLFSASGQKFDDESTDVEASGPDEPGGSHADLTDKLSTLLTNSEGTSRFLGASSGFSLFSPQGLQWISEKTGSNDLSESISKIAKVETPWPLSKSELWHQLSPSDQEPLPSRKDADVYVAHYFNTFNYVFPLYDRDTFYKSYDLHYSGNLIPSTAWYASLNVVLFLGCMNLPSGTQQRNSMRAEEHNLHAETAWKYFRNAASCFVELVFETSVDLSAVQAIIGMAFIQKMSIDPQSLYMLIAVAGRMAYGIGLHRKLDHFGLSQSEINQRRNVFWILYYLDKDISIRIGQPSVLADDDIGIGLPQAAEGSQTLHDNSKGYPTFTYSAQLALLEGRIYSELYSIRARNRTDLQRLHSVGQLDKELLRWRDSLPVEIRPGESIQCSSLQHVPVVMMHFSYLDCLSTLHRASMNHGSWINIQSRQDESVLHDQNLNPRVYTSHSICLSTARNTIELLQNLDDPQRRTMLSYKFYVPFTPIGEEESLLVFRLGLYYPLSAFLILFANIIYNPKNVSVASDLKLMRLVTSYFSSSGEPKSIFSSPSSTWGFNQLYKVAVKYAETNGTRNTKPAKRGYGDIDSRQISGMNFSENPIIHDMVTSTTNPAYVQAHKEQDTSHPSTNNLRTQQTHTHDFPNFTTNTPESISSDEFLSNGEFLYTTDMAGMPIVSDTLQWGFNLQDFWNGSLLPEN